MPIKATSQTWTLRFKHHKTTIMLHVDKTQTFSSIKTELLSVLHETQKDKTLDGTPLPATANAIQLARPVDFNDLSLGFESLDDVVSGRDIVTDETTPKAKGKGKSTVSGGGFKDCPLGAGLRDGCAVAFRFREEEDGEKKEGEDEWLEDGEKREWDVVVPSYEDVYGLEEMEAEGEDEGS